MSNLSSGTNYAPQVKGYRIRQQVRNQQDQNINQQTLLKIIVKNQTNGIPKIRNDVICNGKHYPFIPLFSFTAEQDLGIFDQISTIVLRDQNEILCEILSGKVKQIKSSQFKQLKQKLKSIFALDLKIDPQELFLLLISDQISKQAQFNEIFDSVSQTEFINMLKKMYQNCPVKVIPKILRKISKYLNATKGRSTNSVQRLKKLFKMIKSIDQANQIPEKNQVFNKTQVKKQTNQQQGQEYWTVVQPKSSKSKQARKQISPTKKATKVEQKPVQKIQQIVQPPKQNKQVVIPVVVQDKAGKVTAKVAETQKVTKKQKVIKIQKQPKVKKQQTEQKGSQNQEDWENVDASNDEVSDQQDVKDSIDKMAFHADQSSDDDVKYVGPKKKNKKQMNNITIPLDPQVEKGLGKKQPRLKKQKKNNNHSGSNGNYNRKGSTNNNGGNNKKLHQQDQDETFDRRNNNNGRGNNRNRNGGNNNDQNSQRGGRRQFSKEKKIDPRILLGINGAPDSIWRQRMRPPKYPRNQNNNSYDRSRGERGQSTKQNQQSKTNKVSVKNQPQSKQTKQIQSSQPSKNLMLKKIFSIPQDQKDGKVFRFENRNYNLFVNKLFWVNITDGQLTIQKDGKGYMRKSAIEIIDNGKGIMAEGLTITTDAEGLSNLQDGGTSFGDPVFEEFTPNGQWFHLTSLDVYAYE